MITPPSDYISHLITMIRAFSDPWGLKAPDSRHIYMNDEARRFTCTPAEFNPEGRRDSEFPAAWAELEDDLIAHDHQASNSGTSSLVIETHHWYGDEDLRPYLSEKFPVFDDNGQCVAILWNARPVMIVNPLIVIDNRQPGVISTSINNNLFTQSESETLFYLLQGISAKEIAQINGISLKTVSNRIQIIFQKANVHSQRQLEEFCRTQGFADYLPPHLLRKGLFLVR
ncbi:LuxR C-terminal-related transcriptional regulator [Erwinia sp. P6884]|uniref:helix-turn-helix transcriptional regulator n=1 Tax=Erwinia sp. P6884 TaxID=3141450 RepID=UPI00318A85AC